MCTCSPGSAQPTCNGVEEHSLRHHCQHLGHAAEVARRHCVPVRRARVVGRGQQFAHERRAVVQELLQQRDARPLKRRSHAAGEVRGCKAGGGSR
eukprot:352220-Chlamydomonas_euryale.AAC.2